jgi:hypothetical protein
VRKTGKMAETKITINSNGSIKIDGDFEIRDREGNLYDLLFSALQHPKYFSE